MNRKEKQAQTRAALVDAGKRVFSSRGFLLSSVDDIAAEAGYTKGAFYANFASKEELYLAILDERFAEELAHVEHALTGDQPPAEAARAAASDFIGFIWSDPGWPRLFFEFTAHAARDDAFRQRLAGHYRELHDRIAEVFRRWSAGFDEPPPIPLDAITTMTFCMANGFILEGMIHPDLDRDLYPTMLEVFFRGLMSMALEQKA